MIIDTHVHLGWDHTFDEDFTKRELISKMEMQKVDIQIVQPGACHDIDTVKEQHDAIAALCREYPKRFFGMANPNPHLPGTLYQDEIRRCVEELGFIAIKVNTIASGVNPNTHDGRKGFDAARKYKIPIMVHTGAGIPFASPVNLITMSDLYPDVKIIMAHCGEVIFGTEAEAAFAARSNIYGETSWSRGFIVKQWMKKFGQRFMIGSDHADNMASEICKLRSVGLSKEDQEAIFGGTALEVFRLHDRV